MIRVSYFVSGQFSAIIMGMRYFKYVFTLVLSIFFVMPGIVAAEEIQRFDVKAVFNADRHLTVQETIVYDFGELERHGIFRIIPDVYNEYGTKYRLRLDIQDVTMDGMPVPWEIVYVPSGLEVKIGSASTYLSGVHAYQITYATDRALQTFRDHDELYWNVVGTAWEVPIKQASVTVEGPGPANKVICFTGAFGTTEEDCAVQNTAQGIKVSTTRVLNPQEGFTIVAGYPLGTLTPLSAQDRLVAFVRDNAWIVFPVLVFFFMLFIWLYKGREPEGRGVIIAEYEAPRGLPPALLSSLMEQRMSQRAVTATLVDLARRGYLKIQVEPTLHLIKRKPADEKMLPFERRLFKGLFFSSDFSITAKSMSEMVEKVMELRNKSKEHEETGDDVGDEGSLVEVTAKTLPRAYWTDVERARKSVFDELRERGLFERNPTRVRTLWVTLGFVVLIGSWFLASTLGVAFVAGGFLSACFIWVFGWHMPRVTREGALVVEEVKGFKRFLSVTEKARLDFSDAPERKPEQFAELLPAAIALGVEAKWAKQFAGLNVPRPSYVDGNWDGMHANMIALSFVQFHNTVSASYHTSSSGGGTSSGFSGGSSGGGFGGGGGGSW